LKRLNPDVEAIKHDVMAIPAPSGHEELKFRRVVTAAATIESHKNLCFPFCDGDEATIAIIISAIVHRHLTDFFSIPIAI